jgi:hypothetical protein
MFAFQPVFLFAVLPQRGAARPPRGSAVLHSVGIAEGEHRDHDPSGIRIPGGTDAVSVARFWIGFVNQPAWVVNYLDGPCRMDIAFSG